MSKLEVIGAGCGRTGTSSLREALRELGFEPYHMRAVADELREERGRRPEGGNKWLPAAAGLKMHTKPWVRARAARDYWYNLKPAGGREGCPCLSKPNNWGVTQGDDILKQKYGQETDETEIQNLRQKAKDQGFVLFSHTIRIL